MRPIVAISVAAVVTLMSLVRTRLPSQTRSPTVPERTPTNTTPAGFGDGLGGGL
jgi:hypothetical protein